jgi:hypothetical protein
MKEQNQKVLKEYQQGEDLWKAFNTPEWKSVVEVEQSALDRATQLMATTSHQRSNEEYVRELIYLKGQRDAIRKLWTKRDELIKKLKQKEEQDG